MKKVIYAFSLGIVCIASSADQDLSGRVKDVEGNGGIVYFGLPPQHEFSADSITLKCLSIDELREKNRSIKHAIRNVKDPNEIAGQTERLKAIRQSLIDKLKEEKIQRKIEKIKFVHSEVELSELLRKREKKAEEQKTKPLPFGGCLFSGAQKKLQRSESVNGLPSENLDVEVDRKDAAMSLPSVSFVSPQSTTEEGVTNENFNLLGQRLSQGRERLSRTASVGSIRESAAVAQDPIDENLKALLASLEHVHVKTHALFGQTLED